eukprot:11497289-Alexandrium_andersonii.AAC.1
MQVPQDASIQTGWKTAPKAKVLFQYADLSLAFVARAATGLTKEYRTIVKSGVLAVVVYLSLNVSRCHVMSSPVDIFECVLG